jgi:hypothetical protein
MIERLQQWSHPCPPTGFRAALAEGFMPRNLD